MKHAATVQGLFYVTTGLCDLYFAGKRRISPVYFGDAAAEAALAAGWIRA